MKKSIYLSVFFLAMCFNAYSQDYYYIPDSKKSKSDTTKNKSKTVFKNITEIEYAIGEVEAVGWGSVTQKYLGIQTINGYQLNPYFSMGIGIGLTHYSTYIIEPVDKSDYIDLFRGGHLMAPVFLDLSINFTKKSVTPFISFDGGYSVPIESGDHGGLFVNPSFGLKYYIAKKTAINISFGYRYSYSSFDLETVYEDFKVEEIFNHFSLKTGFTF